LKAPSSFTLRADEAGFLDPDGSVGDAKRVDPADPARVAAGCLLARALQVAGTTVEEVGRDGSVCLVVVPEVSWAKILRDEWRSIARGGERYEGGEGDRYWNNSTWVAWVPDEPPRPYAQKAAAERLAISIAEGYHCVGFAADISWLPSDLVQAADYRLTVPTLTAEDVALIANLLCGHEPAEMLSDERAARLVPRLLRLARRLDQTADAYVHKLRELLDHNRPVGGAITSGSRVATPVRCPREAPTLTRLFGMDEAVDFGMGVARDVKDFKEGKIGWTEVDNGCLLSGPPGMGKPYMPERWRRHAVYRS
jgi:cell division protease FtsH